MAAALQERRDAYRMAGKPISYAQQCAELPECKEVRPDLAEVPAQVLQDAVKRVDLLIAPSDCACDYCAFSNICPGSFGGYAERKATDERLSRLASRPPSYSSLL